TLNSYGSVLYLGARRKTAFLTILRDRSSGAIPGLNKSSGACSKKERQKPRWLVAVRRCLEFSRAQRWRAEPLLGFRTTRPSFARLSRATGTLVGCASPNRARVREVDSSSASPRKVVRQQPAVRAFRVAFWLAMI